MHTEDEAKTKWCPEHRLWSDGMEFACNSVRSNQETARGPTCIGSQCMHWRWSYTQGVFQGEPTGPKEKTDTGYCGLSGKPE